MVWEWEWTKYKTACHTLGLEYEHTIFDIKTQYRAKALVYHPDKCSEEGAVARFREIQEAYEYLKRHKETPDLMQNGDGEGEWSNENGNGVSEKLKDIACMIMHKMAKICEKKTRELLEKLEYGLLERLLGVLELYPSTIPEPIRDMVRDIANTRRGQTECIIINPLLDDVLADNLYSFERDGKKYIVPLWHHELVYDVCAEDVNLDGCCNGNVSEMVIQVNPILPDNVSIDANNNLHVRLTYHLLDIWYGNRSSIGLGEEGSVEDGINFWLGRRQFVISRRQICMMEKQTLVLCGQGISQISHTDIYDVSQKGDVVVHLCIYHE